MLVCTSYVPRTFFKSAMPTIALSCTQARLHQRLSMTLLHWLRALLTLLVLFTVSSSAWAQTPCVTWTPTAGQLSSGSYRYQLPLNGACDPTNDGLYTSPGQIVGTLHDATDNSSFSVDLGIFPNDILVFTPTANTVATSWMYKVYRWDDTPVYIAINLPAGVPTLTGASPNSASATGGQSVTLTGTNFVSGATVSFGGTLSPSVVVNNPTTITATTPAHAGGTVNVVVNTSGTGGGGGGSATLTNGFTFNAPAPTVTALSPAGGPSAGGTSVTITGTNFTGATGVNFGATPATNVVVVNSTTITATSPMGTAPVDVTVTTSAGTSAVNSPADRFTYAPTVTGVSPSSGAMSGGGAATITGTGFTNATSVTFGANAALPYTIVNDTTITVASVPGGTGTIDVKVTNSAGTSAINANDQYTYRAAPTVTSVTPNAGKAGVGTSVTINGSGFSSGGVPTVSFGGSAATGVTVLSDTVISATSPLGAAATIDVTVTNTNGTSATSANDQFTFVGVPSITSLGTTEGPLAGGTSVMINGSGLKTASSVKFGTVNATSFTVNSDGQITVTAPAGSSAGVVDVTVTTIGGTSPTSSADQFTYRAVPTVTGVSPSSGLTAGSDAVVISGSGFTSASTVKFGGVSATNVVFNSSNQLAVRSPPGTGTVDVTVTTTGGTSATNASDQFTYRPIPVVTSLSPTSGGITGNTKTIIKGSGFTGTVGVTFGGSPASSFNIDSDTQLTVYSPSGPSGTVDVVVTTPNGTSATSASSKFTYYPAPTIAGVFPNSALATGGTAVVISGTNFVAGSTTVSFGGAFVTPTTVTSTSMTVSAPAGTPGPATITVNAPGGTATQSGSFTYIAFPTVSSISPTTGPLAGGTTVTILGSGFTNASSVGFGASMVTPTVNSDTQITVTAPSSVSAGVKDVTVTVPSIGTSATSANTKFTYAAVPATTTISPASGPAAGGTTVTISGTGFTNATAVMFSTGFGTNLTVVSDTQLTVKAPSGTAGSTADVTVMTPGGTSPPNPSVRYTFVAAPVLTGLSMTAGPSSGGTAVTITGSGFTGATSVTFGGVAGTGVNVISDTIISVTSPAGAGTVDVNVTTPGGVSASSSASKFTYAGLPAVSAISPTTGPTAGGTSVVITGTGFSNVFGVSFGGAAATGFTVNSVTQITATSPAGTGAVDVRVTTAGGTSPIVSADQFTYAGTPTVTSVTPNNGLTTGGTSVTIVGTGFTGATGVKFGTNNASAVTVVSPTQITATSPAGTAGVTNVTVTTPGGTSATGTGNQFTYNAPPAINFVTTTLPGSVAGTAGYNQSIQVTGGVVPYVFSITSGGVPTGLTFDPATGALTGKPTAVGSFTFVVQAKDANNLAGTQSFTVQITAPVLSIDTTALPNATVGVAYSQALTGSGGGSPYTYTTTSALPAGLTFANGTISGMPTQTGPFSLAIKMTDSTTGNGAPFSTTKTLTLTVDAAALRLAPTTLPMPMVGQAYNQVFTASGGTPPYRYSVSSGSLPTGLSIDPSTGVLSGAPTATGTSTFTITASDSSAGPGTPFAVAQTFTLQTRDAVPVANGVVIIVAANSSNNTVALGLTGGVAASVTVITQPSHGATTVSGTSIAYTPAPGYSGSDTFTYTATNASGTSAPATVLITVNKPVPTAPAIAVSTLASKPVTIDAAANATGGPFTGLAVASAPASGKVVVQGLSLIYTPSGTVTGPVSFAYTLNNSSGPSQPIAVTVQVNPVPIVLAPIQVSAQPVQTLTVDVTAGASGGPFVGAAILGVVPANAGTATLSSNSTAQQAGMRSGEVSGNSYTITFAPAAAFAGTAVVSYTLSNMFITSAPATLSIVVASRADPSADADVRALVNAQIQSARRFSSAQLSNYHQRLEQLRSPLRQEFSNQLSVVMPMMVGGAARDCKALQNPLEQQACYNATANSRSANQTNDASNIGVSGSRSSRARLLDGSVGFTDSRDIQAASAGLPMAGAGDRQRGRSGALPYMGGEGDEATGVTNRPQWAFWTAGSVDFGFADASYEQSGFKFTTSGVTVGADYLVSDKLAVGAGLGYGRDRTKIGDMGTQSNADSVSAAVYGSYSFGRGMYLDGVAGYSRLSFDSRRWVVAANDFAQGKRDGDQWFAALSAGYEYRDKQWLVSPYGRVLMSRNKLKRFDEKGAGINALTYFDQSATTTSGVVGLRTEFSQETRWGVLLPFARVEFQHDFEGQSDARLSYSDIAGLGAVYQIGGTPYGRDRVQLGLGSKLRTRAGTWSLDLQLMRSSGMLDRRARIMFTTQY